MKKEDVETHQIGNYHWRNCSELVQNLYRNHRPCAESSPVFAGADIIACTRLSFYSMVPFFYKDDKY